MSSPIWESLDISVRHPCPAYQMLRRLAGEPEFMHATWLRMRGEFASISEENVTNLAVLAAYLRTLPLDYDSFDMSTYFEGPREHIDDLLGVEDKCDSVACAVGHGPSAGLPRLRLKKDPYHFSTDEGEFPSEEWDVYETRVFGEGLYDPVFNAEWCHVDNTARGAAARILALLENPQLVHTMNPQYPRYRGVGNKEELLKQYAHMVP